MIAAWVATFMLLLDLTVVNVALPLLREDLGASFTDLEWVFDATAARSSVASAATIRRCW